MPLEQIPALVAEVASEQAALPAIQGVLTARLLVTPTAHDSVTDTDRLLTADLRLAPGHRSHWADQIWFCNYVIYDIH